MAVNHRTLGRAVAAVVLALTLVVASLARAEEPDERGKSRISQYVVTPVLVVAAVVVVVALVQAARVPIRDVRRTDRALSSVDRALAAARGDGGYSTRWTTPPKLAAARTRLATARAPAAPVGPAKAAGTGPLPSLPR